jgi:hypothetical protein
MAEKILTLHPDPAKRGVNIEKARYDAMRAAVLDVIGESGELPFAALFNAVGARLPDFRGSIGWYATTVKLDLEARGLIERVPGPGPQRLRLKK